MEIAEPNCLKPISHTPNSLIVLNDLSTKMIRVKQTCLKNAKSKNLDEILKNPLVKLNIHVFESDKRT